MKSPIVVFILCCLSFLSCREKLPVDTQSDSSQFVFQLNRGDYFNFDNWKLDLFGGRIPSSYFRNSWSVTDIGRTLNGATGVAVVVDSVFNNANGFVRSDTLLFRTETNGDVYRWGFLKSLIEERETLQIDLQWDRIAALSLPPGSSWVIERFDSTNGTRGNQTVVGSISASTAYIGPILINGEQRTIFSYQINITKPGLYYSFWMTNSPTALARMLDESDALQNATLQVLTTINTSSQ